MNIALFHTLTKNIAEDPSITATICSDDCMHTSGITLIAVRVDVAEARLSGVERSLHAGIKRKQNAGPIIRDCPSSKGNAPLIQTLLTSIFRSTVVNVAVATESNA